MAEINAIPVGEITSIRDLEFRLGVQVQKLQGCTVLIGRIVDGVTMGGKSFPALETEYNMNLKALNSAVARIDELLARREHIIHEGNPGKTDPAPTQNQ